MQPRIRVRQRRVSIPAVLRAGSILNLTLIGNPVSRHPRRFQKILHQINRIIQKVSVVTAHIQMNLPPQLRPQRCPIPLQLRVEIVMLLPILSDLMVDLPGLLIEDRLGIPIRSLWGIYRLPNIKLFPRPTMISKRRLICDIVAHRNQRMSHVVTHPRLFYLLVRALDIKHVVVLIQISGHICMKVHWIRAGHKRSVVVVWIENLYRERLPPTRRSAIHKPRPTLPDPAKLLLHGWNQLRFNRVSIRPQIR